MLEINGLKVSLDFILCPDEYSPVIISFYDRSLSLIKAVGAALNTTYKLTAKHKTYYLNGHFDIMIAPIVTGKDKFYHAIAISDNKKVMVFKEGDQEEAFYNFLMNNFNLPLLKQWKPQLYDWALRNGYVNCAYNYLIKGANCISSDFIDNYGEKIYIDDLRALIVNLNEKTLINGIKYLFSHNKIWISKMPQKKLNFTDMDSYFKIYGKSIVKNLENLIQPLTGLNGHVDCFVMKKMRLFPQQAAQVSGVLALLDCSSYAILNEGMGTGKTVQAAGICEGYFVRKYLRANPNKTLRDVYLEEGIINYRNIVMCPGHLVEKWANHIKSEIPYSRVTILNDFSQLVEIKKRGKKRSGREFFIISKDFAKLSYQSKPIPRKRRFGHIMKKVCRDCGRDIPGVNNFCEICKSTNIKLVKSGYKGEGMVCYNCNNILIPYKTAKLYPFLNEGEYTKPLDFIDFIYQNQTNSYCYYCGAELWQPHVANLGCKNGNNCWYRVTHYSNKTHKNKKTVWVHKDFADDYFSMIGEKPINVINTDEYSGVRKVAPGLYIKKQLKGFFDIAIFDEAHLYKSGSSAQANCMSAIISSSKKHLALTGTIAGGYANHLFYLLFRLDPNRMRKAGYKWEDEMRFIEKYGVIERRYESNEEERYNSSSKGRQKGSPSPKPGISPLIFMDFLLDKTVFLDLSDLSKYLPPLKEIVVLVDIPMDIENKNGDVVINPEYSMLQGYLNNIQTLKKLAREKDGGIGILSEMLHFSLSYLDKPYGVGPIKSPKTGCVLVTPNNYPEYSDINNLLSKEKRLIEIVNKELSENRNCIIYAEFTGKPETCVSYRIKSLLEHYCGLQGKVEVIESSYPASSEREEWMHKKAAEGIRVFITNPRNVETGLDFCFIYQNKLYNYPTLIFYQLGYSLFTIWQSSRRHYRLNQKIECRTYYMAVNHTIQKEVISLIAEKMAATAAIQGKFSTEGLTALANGVDVKLKLAQALASMDDSSGANLQGMFDAINQNVDDDPLFNNYRPMLTLEELLGNSNNNNEVTEEISQVNLLDVFNVFENFTDLSNSNISQYNALEQFTGTTCIEPKPPLSPVSKRKSVATEGQLGLF